MNRSPSASGLVPCIATTVNLCVALWNSRALGCNGVVVAAAAVSAPETRRVLLHPTSPPHWSTRLQPPPSGDWRGRKSRAKSGWLGSMYVSCASRAYSKRVGPCSLVLQKG